MNKQGDELTKWQKEVLATFDRIKNDTDSYELHLDGVDIVVLPHVFSPKYFTDSLYFAQEVRTIVKKGSLLEIGSGTGIVSLFAALNGAHVVATDINPDAVKNTEVNFKKHVVDAEVRLGNMFEPIKEGEQFDYIFWNHPFNNWNTPVDDVLLKAGLDYTYEGLKKYISQGKRYLKEDGHLLLGTGDFADQASIVQIAEDNGYKLKVLSQVELPITETPVTEQISNTYYIYELV